MGREHGSEHSLSINCVEFRDRLMGCWFLERGFTVLHYLVKGDEHGVSAKHLLKAWGI